MTVERQPPESLERRPDARAFKVEDLLVELRSGRIRIPSFQRGIKWQREDAAKLFDSLYRGYPVGTLLFWETHAEAAEVRFGTLRIAAAARSDALLVVDGQQRLMSLARVLLAPDGAADAFALYFDLDEAAIVPPPKGRETDPSRWLPMTEVLDSERLMQWVFTHAAANKNRRERAFALGKRIREYEIPAYLVRTANEDILREIFGRINFTGKILERTEVFDALHGARGGSRPASIGEIVSELSSLGFGRVEEKLLYQLLRVLRDKDVTERATDEPLRLSDENAAVAYRETAETATRVIQFLKTDAGIPHFGLLPYKQPFLLLGKFFKHHPNAAPRSRDLLARWIWRGAIAGVHQGNTVSTRTSLERILEHDESASVKGLLAMVTDRQQALSDVTDGFNFRYASSKLQVLALLDLNPRDLESGEHVSSDTLLDRPAREGILPTVVRTDANGLERSIANRLAHPDRPQLRRLLLAVDDAGILASHGISPEAIAALKHGDTDGFFAARAALLRERFAEFFARHARWDETDRPPLAALVVDDEEA